MIEAALIIVGGFFCIIGVAGGFYAMFFQLQISRHRRPDVSWVYASWWTTIFSHPELYTEDGLFIRHRIISSLKVSAVCFAVTAFMGILLELRR
jgi:hypothetical protein